MDWSEYIRVFTALFAVVDPLGVIPFYLTVTENVRLKRRQIARVTGVSVAVILCVTVVSGEHILNFFNISIDAFRIAGGIFLMTMALSMFQARDSGTRHTPEEDREAIVSKEVAVVPLAIPLLAGPGAISTVIVLGHQMPTVTGKFTLGTVCLLIALITWLILRLAPQIDARLSTTALNISVRVMGLIVAAIAVEFIVGGLRGLLPGLAA